MAKGSGVVRTIIALIIGGTVYAVSQTDIINNFSEETGMSQSEAKQYVENIPEDELVSFYELGTSFISDGKEILNVAAQIDCFNYKYEWESSTLTCGEGKSQLVEFGNSEIALGEAYRKLSSTSASEVDINSVIRLIDRVNENYRLEIIAKLLNRSDIDEAIKTNLYNKSVLRAALESK